jgi:hypothetical protein
VMKSTVKQMVLDVVRQYNYWTFDFITLDETSEI